MSRSSKKRRAWRDRRRHHAADPKRSARLQRLLVAIPTRGERTSLDVIQRARIVGLSAAVDELRTRGFKIHCERRAGLWYWRRSA